MHPASLLPALGAASLLGACASAGGPGLLSAERDAAARVPLPPVPRVTGPLTVAVVYPRPNQSLTARDSNFIFGSVGRGGATLTINGTPVPVLPNGAFLAWLPVPAGPDPRYDLVAASGADTARAALPVRTPASRLPESAVASTVVSAAAGGAARDTQPATPAVPPNALVVDTSSVAPRGSYALRADEPVRVSVRASADAVWLAADSVPRGFGSAPPLPAARIALTRSGTGDLWSASLPAGRLRIGGAIVAARGADTVRLPVARVVPAEELPPVTLSPASADSGRVVSDTDRVVVGRPTQGGTYKWFFLPGTVLPATGQSGDWTRVRLAEALEVWVSASDAEPRPAGSAVPRRIAGNARVAPAREWVDLVVPTGERPPFLVEEGDRTIALTLYGTVGNPDVIQHVAADPLVQHVAWSPEATDRVRFTAHLSRAPYGYQVLWNGSALVLRIRRPPAVDRRAPLRGLTIAVDAGHPPIGATGPTGLYEAVPTLAVAQRVQRLLAERGARVVMTRSTAAPVALGDRPVMARRANAHALVSIHLNALPDGINPFTAHGTGTYYFHPHAVPLARAVQRGMVRRMGLRDLGIYYDNLALARPTWMPSVLCEGAFIMVPEQEVAMRTPQYQEAYARGIVEGLERFFLGIGAEH